MNADSPSLDQHSDREQHKYRRAIRTCQAQGRKGLLPVVLAAPRTHKQEKSRDKREQQILKA